MLVRLFSDTDLLVKTFHFRPGLNIVLGKYSGEKNVKEINGIGKSTLVRLISFCFLSSSAENRFLQPKYDFLRDENHSIILEFKINDKSYYIKRTFEKQSSILFGESLTTLESYSRQELKAILSNKLFPFDHEDIFFKGERLGTLLDFYIKDDLQHLRRIEATNFSSGTSTANNKAIFNFFLLGLPTRNLISFKDLSDEYERFFNAITGFEDKIRIDYQKSIEEYRSERIKIEQNILVIEKTLKDYKFLEEYKKIESELISLTGQITIKLKQYYSLEKKQQKIRESFQFNPEVDIRQVRSIYNETKSIIGDLVSRTIEEVLEFKKDIIESRNKFLVDKETELQKAVDETLNEITRIEKKRSVLYQILDEKGALDSIENAYGQLTNEKTRLATNQQIIKQVEDLQGMLGNLAVTITEVKRDILLDIKENDSVINLLRTLFLDILKNAIVLDVETAHGYFDVSPKSDSKRNQLPFKIEVEIPKADALGQSRLKIVAYDLMVFLKNIMESRKFPRFLIHDGVYHGIALVTKLKTLNYIYHQSLIHPDFQYIASFNEDEIYIPNDMEDVVGKFQFELSDLIIAEFTDNPSQMIFKRDF